MENGIPNGIYETIKYSEVKNMKTLKIILRHKQYLTLGYIEFYYYQSSPRVPIGQYVIFYWCIYGGKAVWWYGGKVVFIGINAQILERIGDISRTSKSLMKSR